MNIQVFGTNRCFDTKKAVRYLKERNIKYQFIHLKEKGMSDGKYNSVDHAAGGLEIMLNPNCKDKDTLALIQYIAAEDWDDKELENQQMVKTLIVRKGMSEGEYNSVEQVVSRLEVLLNPNCKDKDKLALIQYIAAEDWDDQVLENQQMVTPFQRSAEFSLMIPDIP